MSDRRIVNLPGAAEFVHAVEDRRVGRLTSVGWREIPKREKPEPPPDYTKYDPDRGA